MPTMRACLLTEPRRMVMAELPRPTPGPQEVLVRSQSVGLCGTDFHIYSGEANYHLDHRGQPIPLQQSPQVLGHEITGVVVEIGPQVRDLVPGTAVVIDQGRNCHSAGRTLCDYCASGDSHQCEHYREHGITGLPGALAEYLAVPAVNCLPIRSGLSTRQAVMTEPLACVCHALARLERSHCRYGFAGDSRISTAVVLGAGPAGLLFLQMLRRVLRFDGELLVCEPDASKRGRAAHWATPLDPHHDDVPAAVLERSQGRGAELVIEAAGTGSAFALIPQVLRKQGNVLLYGVGHGGVGLELLSRVQWREPNFVLSVGASGGFDAAGRPSVYQQALRLIEAGTIEVESLVSHDYCGLDAVPAAFAGDHCQPGYIKGVVQVAP